MNNGRPAEGGTHSHIRENTHYMNRLITGLAVATAATAISSTAMAQAYLGAAGGRGSISVECAGLSSCDKKGEASRFLMGYRFAPGIAPEFGVSDFGSAKQTLGSTTVTTSVAAFTFGVAVDAPFGRWAGLTSRVGVARLKTKVSSFSFSESDANTAPYVGLGLYVAPWRNIRIELGFDMSRAEFDGDKGDVEAVLLGVRAQF
jgi:opacity protein-like surface antigen